MKKLFRFASIFLSMVICLCLLFSSYTCLNVRANNSDRVVSKRTGTWGSFPFTVKTDNYYIINDSTGLVSSTYNNPTFYYTNDNVTFYPLEGQKTFFQILNSITGVIIAPSLTSGFFSSFCTSVGLLDTTSHYAKNGLYDSNGTFYGYCINDIGGCYLGTNPPSSGTVSRDFTDNIINFYNYYTASDLPDFVTYYPFSDSTIISNLKSNYLTSEQITWLESKLSDVELLTNVSIDFNSGSPFYIFGYNTTYARTYGLVTKPEYGVFVTSGNSTWDKFLKYFNVDNLNSIVCSDLDSNPDDSWSFSFRFYSSNGNQITDDVELNVKTMTMSVENNIDTFEMSVRSDLSYKYNLFWHSNLTIYKDSNVKTSLDNQTYYPDYYVTDSYNNYDSNNDNSFTIDTMIDSLSYNSSIYTDCNNSYYNYYDDGYYDSSSSTTNVTNITNNYYSGSSNPDDPDNPNDPDDPDDPSGTLDAILQAILRFFNAIGDIIGTLLASIINLIDSVLEALAGVMENLTGMSDFFASLFAWIPSPVPEILGAGFGICLVCGIIKFIRG